jgi:hypothetical protein
LLQGFGALPLGLALVGMVAGWRRWRTETVLVAAFPAVYLAFMLPKAVFWVRLVLPLLPFCSLLAAIGLGELADRLRPSGRAAGLTALLLLALAQPLANDVRHDRLLTQTDTRVLANDWVQANLPPGSHLRIHDWSLKDISAEPRLYTPNAADLQFDRFEGNTDVDQVRYLADHDVQYVVTSSYFYERYLIDPPLPRQKESGRRHQRQQRNLEQEANLIARFSPGVGGSEVPYRYDDMYTPFWSLEQFERTGPTIRVYSLARLGAAAVGSTGGP